MVSQIAAGGRSQTLYSEGHRRFQILRNRDVRLAMVFSEGDHALDEMHSYMGRSGARLRRYPNASVLIIPDADHDFTHARACAAHKRAVRRAPVAVIAAVRRIDCSPVAATPLADSNTT
jgi:hypothetical protein